jgi:serine/threonine protein kinase
MFQGTPMLTDFALSTTFKGQENSFSSGTTGLSRLYAAPEVVSMELRNTSQDIFSLGLVFQDIFWTLHGSTHGNATDTCGDHRQHSYQGSELMPEERKFFAELPKLIFDWSPVLREKNAFCSLIRIMTAAQPVDRPSAKVVGQFLMRPSFLGQVCGDCCHSLLAFYTQEAGTWPSWTAIKRTATGTTYVSSIPSSDPPGPIHLAKVHDNGPRFDVLDVSVRFAASQNRDAHKIDDEEPGPQRPESHYEKFVRSRGFLPHLGYGFNWSGRGRHVEYTEDEQPPLTPIKVLGMGGFALVEAVRCGQVVVARKSVRMLHHRGTLDEIFREVEHLEKLRHRHTIQLVGTYLQRKTLSHLIYPVANCNLSEFMELCFGQSIELRRKNRISLKRAFACLAQAVDYLHEKNIIHRHIKPTNILVKFPTADWDTAEAPHGLFTQVYVSDFGFSKFLDGGLTEARTLVGTPAYMAPEIDHEDEPESYDLSVDIFSLGCVFLEMQSVLLGQSVQELWRAVRGRFPNRLYGKNPDGVAKAIQSLMQHKSPIDGLHIPPSEIRSRLRMISKMTSQDPLDRPIAGDVAMAFGSNECCHLDREAEGGFDPEASEVKRDPGVQSWNLDAEATRPAVPEVGR